MGKTRKVNISESFGRLTVISETVQYLNHTAQCFYRCECGVEKWIYRAKVESGNTKSCGCLKRERDETYGLKHGKHESPHYKRWKGMKSRCYVISSSNYHRYGGRGITVCDEWLDPAIFVKWCENTYPGEGYTLDRKDNNGNYDPLNCKWSTYVEQSRNNSQHKRYLYNGEELLLCEIVERYHPSLDIIKVRGRITNGKTLEEALNV
jgi:hypothetical protein